MIMATGAVEPTGENLAAWFRAGVTAVGMGSKLFPKEAIDSGDWNVITDLCKKVISWIRQAKD
jgi:2-dehydro-3-deoxyphosphogluconate aldolase/(4S)-4-hydroxy-2-oxoglutarate aldolase